jgi:2,4-diketo-3-deoxy-L-fuconate hydrolase
MKLVRHGASGDEKPGLVDAQGVLRDLSAHVRDIAGPALSRETLERLRRLDPASLPALPAETRLGPCVGGTRNFVAIGLNFTDHAAESSCPRARPRPTGRWSSPW